MVLIRTSITIFVLAWMILMGFSSYGYSQQQPDSLQTPGKKQPPPVGQAAATWPRKQVPGLRIVVDLSVTPLAYTGSCPVVFTFKGQIYVNKATPVQYKFIRSDGVYSETKMLVFDREGRQEVTHTWQVGDAGPGPQLSGFSGAVVMEVIYPPYMKIQSGEAIVRGTCTGQVMSEPENSADQKAGQQRMKPETRNSPNQQATQQGPPVPQPAGQQGPPAMAFPPVTSQQGQSDLRGLLPQPTGQQGQAPMPAGQQGQPAMGDGDCVSFNPATTTAQQNQAGWTVADGARTLFSFGVDKIEVKNTLAIVKHYRMDRSCFVGLRPSFHYMLAGGSSPVGPFPGEDCRSFNPAMTRVLWIKGWRIADGNNALFNFDADRDGANQALAIIKKYGFTHTCMMARGKVDFLYLRK